MYNTQFAEIDNQNNLPHDSISHLQWISDCQLAVSSWHGFLRIYELKNQKTFCQIFEQNFTQPITAFVFQEQENIFIIALLSKEIVIMSQNQTQTIYKAKSFIQQIIIIEQQNCILLFGEKYCHINFQNQWMVYQFDYNVTHTDCIGTDLISCFSYKQIAQYNLSHLLDNKRLNYVKNRLDTQYSKIGYFDYNQFLLCGWDGRVSVNKQLKDEDFVFKAHSQKYSDGVVHYQINDLAIGKYKQYMFAATAGSDGQYKIWNILGRDIYSSYDLKSHVTNLCYNQNTQMIAVATGYDWSHGIWGFKQEKKLPELYIHILDDNCFQINYKQNVNSGRYFQVNFSILLFLWTDIRFKKCQFIFFLSQFYNAFFFRYFCKFKHSNLFV